MTDKPAWLVPGARFALAGEAWEIIGTVNSGDDRAFLEDCGHDIWVARNVATRERRMFTTEFLADCLCVVVDDVSPRPV